MRMQLGAQDALHEDREEARIRAAYARRCDGEAYSWFNPAHLHRLQRVERAALALLKRHRFVPLHGKRILEVGCGSGSWVRMLIQWGAEPEELAGIDLICERIAEARRTCPAGVDLRCGSAAALEYPEASFDLVLQATMFSSVLDGEMKRCIAAEMLRVLKPDGLILWYDFHMDNPRNSDVRGIRKREVRELFPHCRVELQRITLAPPLARIIAQRSWWLGSVLAMIPPLCTHYLGSIRKI